MKKTDVYVVVDTPKKSKKLKKVLDMFKEAIYHETTLGLSTGFDSDGDSQFEFPYLFIDDDKEWCGYYDKPINKTKVSLKELRNILAKEHLKEGDIIVAGIGSTKYVVNVEKVNSSNTIPIGGNKWICIDGDDYPHEIEEGEGGFNQFIRYATEEEKALLEPKKELEVGKWYLIDCEGYYSPTARNAIVYENGEDYSYGFDFEGKFINDFNLSNCRRYVIRELTPQEVKQSLIKEANIIGHAYTEYDYNPEENELCEINNGRLESVFCDGHWGHPTSNFTDYDIAIVERLHDTLLDNHGYSLESKLLTDARLLANKIKSNIK